MATSAHAVDAPPSAPVLATPAVSPCTPFGVQLTWTAASDDVKVEGYEVLIDRPARIAAPMVRALDPQPATYTFFLDGDGAFRLYEGETMTVTIRAVDSAGQETPSNTQSVAMAPAIAPAVTGFQARFAGMQVPLTWDAHPSACSLAVLRDGEKIADLPPGAVSFVDGAPLHGPSHYEVRAFSRSGSAGPAASVVVTEPLPAVGERPACAGRDTPISASRLVEVSLASVCLVNFERVRAGLAPVWIDERLAAAAAAHARDQVRRDFVGHVDPDGCGASCRARKAGYPLDAGENGYVGATTAAEAVAGWMRSAEHRANILRAGYRTMGAGAATGGAYGSQWVHAFGDLGAPLTAVSGLEARFQGAAVAGAARVDARLRIRSARIRRGGRLTLAATITRLADGGRVRVLVAGRDRTVRYGARIAEGRLVVARTLPARVRARRMTVTVSFAGSPRARAATVRSALTSGRLPAP